MLSPQLFLRDLQAGLYKAGAAGVLHAPRGRTLAFRYLSHSLDDSQDMFPESVWLTMTFIGAFPGFGQQVQELL